MTDIDFRVKYTYSLTDADRLAIIVSNPFHRPNKPTPPAPFSKKIARQREDFKVQNGSYFGEKEPKAVKTEPKSSIEWLAQKTAAAEREKNKPKTPAETLVPVRHPQRDFYVADLLDIAPKDDMASMEHPLFALKAGDKRVREYKRGGTTVTVKPGFDGCATIHDKDVWIYCISQLVEGINRGREDVSRTVRFTAYDFLVTTNRPTSGGKDGGYQRMAEALARLRGTSYPSGEPIYPK